MMFLHPIALFPRHLRQHRPNLGFFDSIFACPTELGHRRVLHGVNRGREDSCVDARESNLVERQGL